MSIPPFSGPPVKPGTYVKYVTGLVGDGATVADRAKIQAAMSNAPVGGTVRVPFVGLGIYLLDAPLITPAGGNIKLLSDPGVTYRRRSEVGPTNYNLIANSAVSTTGSAGMDGAVTAASTAVTSTAFVTGNIGQPFTIQAAGPLYTALSGTVTGVGTGMLAVAATNTVSSMYVGIGPRDVNIEITGGIWDMGTNSTAYGDGYFTRFRRVDGLKINGASFINGTASNACYAIDAGDVTNFVVDDILLNSARDGVHIEGPASIGRIVNIRGTTGDDFIAICAGNYPGYQDCNGPISDIMVDGVLLNNASSGACIIGNDSRFPIRRVTLANFKGTVVNGCVIRVTDDTIMTATYVEGLTVQGINVTNGNSDNPVIRLGATQIRDIRLDDIVHNDHKILIFVAASKIVNTMIVNGLRSFSNPANNIIQIDGQVDDLSYTNIDSALASNGRLLSVSSTGTLSRASLDNFHVSGDGYLFVGNNGAATCRLKLSNGVARGLSFGVLTGIGGGGLLVQLSNVDLDTISNYPFRTNDSTAVLRVEAGSVTQISDHGISLIAGSTASVNGRKYHVDAAILTPVLWDEIYNTNAGVGAGVGPNKWNGAAWVAT